MSEDTMIKVASLGQQALAVVCDVKARDAILKNMKLRTENEALKPLKEKLYSLQILKGTSIIFQSDVQSHGNANCSGEKEEVKFLAYYPPSADQGAIEFPLQDLTHLNFRVSGVVVGVGRRFRPKLVLDQDDGNILIRVDYSEDIHITGKVKKYDGILQDVVGDILRSAGDLAAGGRSLDNATFQFGNVNFSKLFLEPIVGSAALNSGEVEPAKELNDDFELPQLASTMPSHQELCQASRDRILLRAENERLLVARSHFQCISIIYPERTINFELEQGRRGALCADGQAAWTLEPAEEATFHSRYLSNIMYVRLSGVPIQLLQGNHEIEVNLGEGLLIHSFAAGSVEVVYSLWQTRLLWVSIRLEIVERHLELLGIDTSEIMPAGEVDVVSNED